ncbi:hypothetical protein D3C86_1486010 [compost metagenome]
MARNTAALSWRTMSTPCMTRSKLVVVMRVGSGSMASRTLAIRWVRPCTVAASRS